jgi:hypothetical protein
MDDRHFRLQKEIAIKRHWVEGSSVFIFVANFRTAATEKKRKRKRKRKTPVRIVQGLDLGKKIAKVATF